MAYPDLPKPLASLFFYAEQIYTLPACHLNRRDVVFISYISDAAQLLWRGYAAIHARHYRKCAVFLYVGVGALINEA